MLQSSPSPELFGADLQTNAEDSASNEAINKVWLAVVAGLLIATSNTWLFHPQLKQSTYSAPWVYPGHEPGPQTHSI
ncbi:MAG: hypothetical protein C0508_19240 [Cyanobacteria bacterium PR.023]|jgi:hypothetical protein|nr:hypothetical protein [Cyanobacteria bacterium PR.023]MDQ5934930.1 hypothetical protein [Cyanobacteriota bacterium erpe_2018_sw_21hr_WHONDRS-SW48-000092_B_bin.40]